MLHDLAPYGDFAQNGPAADTTSPGTGIDHADRGPE